MTDFHVKLNPFPMAIRCRTRKILERYHKVGAVAYASGIKDPIISNLLALKKWINRTRLVFDARCVNYFAVKGKKITAV